jgi:GntR family transcriptional regulator/MocR family aminotransferase
MELFLDPDDHRSLTVQLYDQIREAIADGRLPPGARLQPSRAVAEKLAIARSTVTDAYARLTGEGFVEGRRGGGSIVTGGACVEPSPAATRTALTPSPQAAAIRRYGSDLATPARYDLKAGRVDARLFPLADWRRCLNHALAGLADSYGSCGDPTGSPELRQALTRWVAQSRGVVATPDQVVVTHGAAHAVDLLARVLLRPGEVAAVEEPGYPPVANLLRTLGVQVAGVPVDEHGLVVDALPPSTRLVYVTPSHQYPLGTAMSLSRRLALLAWAGRNDAAIIEDDYDSEFRYGGRPIEPLQTLDTSGRVIYVGSFSKTMLATLRLGFVVTPSSLSPALRAAKYVTDWHTSIPPQAALAHFIDQGWLARHIRRMRAVYRVRHEMIVHALGQDLADDLTIVPSAAGLHVSATANTASPAEIRAVVERALAAGVAVQPLSMCRIDHPPRSGLALGYGAIDAEHIEEGLRRLRGAFHPA